jgi:hypothetical protein
MSFFKRPGLENIGIILFVIGKHKKVPTHVLLLVDHELHEAEACWDNISPCRAFLLIKRLCSELETRSSNSSPRILLLCFLPALMAG